MQGVPRTRSCFHRCLSAHSSFPTCILPMRLPTSSVRTSIHALCISTQATTSMINEREGGCGKRMNATASSNTYQTQIKLVTSDLKKKVSNSVLVTSTVHSPQRQLQSSQVTCLAPLQKDVKINQKKKEGRQKKIQCRLLLRCKIVPSLSLSLSLYFHSPGTKIIICYRYMLFA